jgi:hypothetical protein
MFPFLKETTMNTIDRAYRHRLVGKIKGLAAESQQLRLTIKKTNKKTHEAKVWGLTYAKQKVGWEARHLLLCYAALRGVPYRTLEPKCRKDNKPDPKLLFQLIEGHSFPGSLVRKDFHSAWEPKWTLEKIVAWLEMPVLTPQTAPTKPEPQSFSSWLLGKVGL